MAERGTDETREVARRILDELPDRVVRRAKEALLAMKVEALEDFHKQIVGAPADDEPWELDDLDAIEVAEREHGRSESRLWRDVSPNLSGRLPMRLLIAQSAERELEKLSAPERQRVQRVLDRFEDTGRTDLRSVHGDKREYYRLRVGELRVVLSMVSNETLLIAAVRPRRKRT